MWPAEAATIQYSQRRASEARQIAYSMAATKTRNRTSTTAWTSDRAWPSPRGKDAIGSEQTMSHPHHAQAISSHEVLVQAQSRVTAERARKQRSATAIATSAMPCACSSSSGISNTAPRATRSSTSRARPELEPMAMSDMARFCLWVACRGKTRLIGGPDTIRTCDLCLRRAAPHPTELRVQPPPDTPNRPAVKPPTAAASKLPQQPVDIIQLLLRPLPIRAAPPQLLLDRLRPFAFRLLRPLAMARF